MSAILKFDFQKRKQLRFSEVNYLKYTKQTQFWKGATTFSLKQGETRTNSGPIPHPLSAPCVALHRNWLRALIYSRNLLPNGFFASFFIAQTLQP